MNGDDRPLELEIGFGKGEHLAFQAAVRPGHGFIGCEPFLDGMVGALGHVDREKLTNVRLHMGDAIEVLERLADASLDRVYLLHPDPWPKARHAKRRFVNPGPIDLVAAKLKPGGEFRLGTDDPVYCRWSLMVMGKRRDFRWLAKTAGDFLDRPDDWPQTRYEAKARKAGREVWYFRYHLSQPCTRSLRRQVTHHRLRSLGRIDRCQQRLLVLDRKRESLGDDVGHPAGIVQLLHRRPAPATSLSRGGVFFEAFDSLADELGIFAHRPFVDVFDFDLIAGAIGGEGADEHALMRLNQDLGGSFSVRHPRDNRLRRRPDVQHTPGHADLIDIGKAGLIDLRGALRHEDDLSAGGVG